jgi:hypothetical protein
MTAVLELILVPVGVIGIPSVVLGLAYLWRELQRGKL